MAGHSHWANIARKKGLVDKKRGKVWSKQSKAIIVAAKSGGDPSANLELRYAFFSWPLAAAEIYFLPLCCTFGQ